MKPGEGWLERSGWRALVAAGRVVGPRVGRGAAAVVLRVRARTAAGWLEGVHRVATRPAPGAPPLTRLPEGWWTASPLVRVRRLGLTVVGAALGSEPGIADLRSDPADAGVRSLHGRGTLVQSVAVTTFDAWAAETQLERLDLVKLDVERAELEALRGMAGPLSRLRPRALIVEVKQRVLEQAGVNGDEVHEYLHRLGYQSTGQVLPVANEVYRPRPPPRSGEPAERLESSAVTSTGSFLARAVADARSDAERRAERLPLDVLRAAAADLPPARGLRAAVRRGPDGPRVIAEVKRRSPSKGDIRIGLDPAALAGAYAAGGASAVSVLTEPRHFAGSPDDLLAVRAAVELPLLRKDFITDRYQVWEARAWGADAVLLIVAALDPPALRALLDEAAEAGLDALVEVHTPAEAEVAAGAGATLVGVNARDLATLEVDPGSFTAVRQALPSGTVLVAESGIQDRAGLQAAAEAGADAVLVGEALVRSDDPTRAVRDLLDRSGRGEMERPPRAAPTPLPAKQGGTDG